MRTAIRKPGAFEEAHFKKHKALSADPSRARYTGACEKGERGKGGGLARPARAAAQTQAPPQAYDIRKLESQFALKRRTKNLCAHMGHRSHDFTASSGCSYHCTMRNYKCSLGLGKTPSVVLYRTL